MRSRTWKDPTDELRKIASRHAINRALHYDDDAQAISGHIQTIIFSIQHFTVRPFACVVQLLTDANVYRVLIGGDSTRNRGCG
jgi:hypothetical protein